MFATVLFVSPELVSPNLASGALNIKLKELVKAITNPIYNYNLPSNVLFLVIASDVVATVKFAKEHGLDRVRNK